MSVMLIVPLLAASAAADCGPGVRAADTPQTLLLRGHTYTRIGACDRVPVYRTPSTDSTFLDRAEADRVVILVTAESVDPTTTETAWPAPTGNLYFSLTVVGDADAARSLISAVLAEWLAAHVPEVTVTEGWEGEYGAHRGPDGRFVSGLALETARATTAIGVDLHIAATPAQYAALSAEREHVSLAALTGRSLSVDDALWWILSAIEKRVEAFPTSAHKMDAAAQP